MATLRVSVKVCDSCGKERDEVFRTRITIAGSPGMIAELCTTCKAPIDRVLAAVASRRTPRTSLATMPVSTLEDIERLKVPKGKGRKAPLAPGKGPRA